MAAKKKSFEESLNRIKEIVSILEKGESSLDESMGLFTEGTALIASCSSMLDEAKQKVTAVSFEENGPKESDFENKE